MRNKPSPLELASLAPPSTGHAKGVARLRSLLTARYDASIVRRVVVLLIFIGPTFLINLFVYYFTARILSAEDFGLFYVAITLGNVAFSGSLVLNIFFTRFLVQVVSKRDADVVQATRRVQGVVGFWGGIVSLGAILLLAPLSKSIGAQSPLVAVLVIADTYMAYLGDIGRAYLQARKRTWQLGFYSLTWMALRLLLCVLGAALFHTVSGTLFGSVLSGVAIVAAFQVILLGEAAPHVGRPPELPRLFSLLPVALGYGLLILVSNLDIVLSYFLLRGGEIGIYSASSVFPKGILVATTPVVQMLFAVMLGDRETVGLFRTTARKTIWVITALACGASFAVWALSPWLCGGGFGLQLCAPMPLHLLLLSTVFLSLLRITVLLEFVQRRDWLILSLTLPTAIYAVVAWSTKPGIEMLAQQFTTFTAAALIFFVLVQLVVGRWRRAEQVG